MHQDWGRQLTLALFQPEPEGLAGFVEAGNLSLNAAVKQWTEGSGERYMLVHGAESSGKSRLLTCAVSEVSRRGQSAVYLPLGEPTLEPGVLENLERLDAVALDNLEAIAGQRHWEEALFGLYNRLRDADVRLLAAARLPAGQLGLTLADLVSRLGAGPSYGIKPLDDDGRARLLQIDAQRRGLRFGEATVHYILSRCPRDPGWLLHLLERIDRVALAEKRKPSVQLVARLLEQEQDAPSPDNDSA